MLLLFLCWPVGERQRNALYLDFTNIWFLQHQRDKSNISARFQASIYLVTINKIYIQHTTYAFDAMIVIEQP